MPDDGLTQKQSDFIKRFITVPKVFGRSEAKRRRAEAAEEFRTFNAQYNVLRDQIRALADPEVKTVLMAQLNAAEAIIEGNAKQLDFAGGHKQLADVEATVALHEKQVEGRAKYAEAKRQMDAQDPENPLGNQSDVDLTWAYVEEKYQAGINAGSLPDMNAAVKAMDRLAGLLAEGERLGRNPFEQLSDAHAGLVDQAKTELTAEALDARRRLGAVHDGLEVLAAKLAAHFGEGKVPLAATMACTAVRSKLDAAAGAKAAALPGLADDAEDAFRQARTSGERLLQEAGAWTRDHAAFRVRYDVMLAHPMRGDAAFVAPKFQEITAAYDAAVQKAGAHDYVRACADLADVRRELKDVLDFADDYKGFSDVLAHREGLLAALPARGTLGLRRLRQAHDAANQLMTDAKTARDAGQMASALQLLNDIPEAAGELAALIAQADDYKLQVSRRSRELKEINDDNADEVLALVADEIAYSNRIKAEAKDCADAGQFARALVLQGSLRDFHAALSNRVATIAEYLAEKALFAARLQETEDRAGPEGRVAIEAYYQRLKADETRRAAAEAGRDYKMALSVATMAKDEHPAMMDLADHAKDYLARKEAFDAELQRLRAGAAGAEEAEEAIRVAEAMLANAVDATTKGNWQAAGNLLQNGTIELRRATQDAANAAAIDGMQDSAKLDAVGTDFDGAYAEFRKVLDAVAALDADDVFAAQLQAADATAQSARQAAEAEPPDADAARQTLEEAIGACKEVRRQIPAIESYKLQLQAAKDLQAEAAAIDRNDAIKPELDAAKEALARADALAKAPQLKFNDALHELAAAQAELRKGLVAGAFYKDVMRAAHRRIGRGITALDKPELAADMGGQLTRLRDLLKELDDAFAARDIATARAKAAQGEELAAAYIKQVAVCIEAIELYKTKIKDAAPLDMTHPAIASEAAQIKTQIEAIDGMMARGEFEGAGWTSARCGTAIDEARAIADAYDRYIPEKLECEGKLAELERRSLPAAGPGHDAVAALRERFDAAAKQEGYNNYNGARKRLDGFLLACTEAAGLLDLFDRYQLAKTRAQAALEGVRKAKTAAIDPLFARLEGKDRNAQRKGDAFDFATGTALYQELENDCATALDAVRVQDNFASVIGQIKEVADDDIDDLKAAIAAAQATVRQLVGRPSSMYIKPEVDAALARLQQAGTSMSSDFDAARADVRAVVDDCIGMALLLAQYDQLNDSAALARSLGQKLLDTHDQADFARDALEGHLRAVDAAMMAARKSKSNRPQSQTDIEAAIAAFRDLGRLLDDHARYVAGLEPLETAILALEKDPGRHLIRKDLTAARRSMDTAATKAAGHDHKAAMAELKAAGVLLDMARLRIKLAANEAPTAKELKTILMAPDGHDKLDDIIKGLEPTAQRKVMNAAFEARFGCKLDLMAAPVGDAEPAKDRDLGRAATNVRRFYEEMSKLPPSDTLDNDSMLIFSHVGGEQTGSYYESGAKEVAMREGDVERTGIYSIGLEHEIEGIHATAVPQPGKEISFFSWNTLHEVGHAVDDKLGYMNKNGEALAGWKSYGSNVGEIAGIVADEFEFDKGYVAEYMLSKEGAVIPVPDPDGCDAAEWERRRQACRIWVDRARVKKEPWQTAAAAKDCTIGDYTYHESYRADWTRYRADQRKFGVSGYQFRAPGEWFSELYAAYHTQRMNPNHPARTWLKDL